MLESQRKRASFPKQALSEVLYEGKQNYEEFIKIQKLVSDDEILKFNPEYIQSHRKTNMLVHAHKLIRYHELFSFNYQMKNKQSLFFSEQMPLSLHFYMFLITLENLCTDKQIEMFYKPAVEGKILGCYAQTELGHGSDIQSLETTAAYDEPTESFIMNTPSDKAAKWWIGDLGINANHAIIFAQLHIKNKKYGLHSFLVPIRDANHNPFRGVEVGEVGPKYGYNSKDNGYVKFTNYRIPRRNMLMKYTKVSKSGIYEKRGNEKISYATMLMIRSGIPFACFYGLSKACVIAVRYSLCRTQFTGSDGKQISILDYQLQQEKVITRISELFAVMFGSQSIKEISKQVFHEAKDKNKFERLNQAHSLTSGLKAIFTNDTLYGMEILRRSLGGHGFSYYSGLPGLISELSPTPTYQGENSVLFLQTARFLLKSLKYISKGKELPPTVAYLHEIYKTEQFVANFTCVEDVLFPENIRKIYLYHSCEALKKVAQQMGELISNGENPKSVWDTKAGLNLTESAVAHTYFWIFHTFFVKIYTSTQNEALRAVMTKLLLLYGIQKILIRSAHYFQTGTITGETVKYLQAGKQKLLAQLRPQALTIVEAFGYDDNTLHSAIGGRSENPYESLLKWVKESNVVNREEVNSEIMREWQEAKNSMKSKL